MGPASIILLMISAWFLVAAAMLWGMLRIVRRHATYNQPRVARPQPAPLSTRRKTPRPKLPRPVLSPAYRAAHHFAHR
ncbi:MULTISPECIES: hypothetical protein [unclassified Pseudomonas]|uniref:hypothetical protein n=1 Tax=unclassified Pseudomonas TaxID=196821 RepID=UPI00244A22B5|nr:MULTISPECIES: hypothetical protein [unclassified Pseudomonas]MDG9926342.1 hypothetical protein [Pseudomonas sp. GD04045]MDH0037591.1 hypothetical protein [Pseudomonas sp. GD04019]